MILKVEELSELKELISQINKLKLDLYRVIDKTSSLVNPETIEASQRLDIVIVKYCNVLKKCN